MQFSIFNVSFILFLCGYPFKTAKYGLKYIDHHSIHLTTLVAININIKNYLNRINEYQHMVRRLMILAGLY